MANIRSVLGKFNKTMGGITFSNWKGQNVVKQKVPDTNGSQSPAQIAQRSKFAALAKLSGAFGPAIRIGMKMAAVSSTEQNVFQSVNAKLVGIDQAGKATVDYLNLQLSQGKVPTVPGQRGAANEPAKSLAISWNDNSNGIDALGTDVAVVVAIDKPSGIAVVSIGDATRADASVTVQVPTFNKLVAENTAIYLFFKRANTTECSATEYVQIYI